MIVSKPKESKMSEPFTKIITYLLLIFLVWEQLGHRELKYQSDAQSLSAEEVSALKRIAIQLQFTEDDVDISDEIDSLLCNNSTKSLYPPAANRKEAENVADQSTRAGGTINRQQACYSVRNCKSGRTINPKNSVSSFTRNIKCSCNNDTINGTTCHVTEIDWSFTQLKGVIAEEFANLTYLENLDLSYNELHDTIPDIWGNLSFLYMLDLASNKLTGEIPKSVGNIKPRIEKNESGICVHFGMDLSNNQLEGPIPATLGDLEKDLSEHERSLEPFSSCGIFSFEIDLSNNHLTGNIPQHLGNLKFLKNLYLDDNLLNGSIPESLSKITYLRRLSVSDNQLSGPIPPALGHLPLLEILIVSDNQLSGPIPPALGHLPLLETLKLDSNNFIGELPTTFSKLINLEEFSIAGNNLSGTFPNFIKDWPNITSLYLAGNSFKGSISSEIFKLSSLNYLRISDVENSDFQFPKSLNWSNITLSTLVLRKCSIIGSIPEDIGRMPNIRILDLSFNELTGNIPGSLRNVGSLSYMSLAENKLMGTIPELILPDYGLFDLSFNDFSNSSITFESNSTKLNLFSSCGSCSSSNCAPQMTNVSEYSKHVCNETERKYNSLHINCGGNEIKDSDGIIYEKDNDSSIVYTSPQENWARISSGEQSIVEKIKCGLSVDDAPLYNEARFASVSLKYYGFCLEDGDYNVTLHFAEIKFANNTEEGDNSIYGSPQEHNPSLKKRIFNIYIQSEPVRTDFNIKERANGSKLPTKVEEEMVHVNNGRLEIHLYWAGKGTYTNGPLISAISVVRTDHNGANKLNHLQVALISVASVLIFALLILFIIAWAKGWLQKEEIHDIQVGPDKSVTFKQLMDATRQFSKNMEIGRGSLGIVYKAELPDKQMVAVKRLSTLSSDGISKLKSEFFTLETLRHENLVQLFDLFFGKGLYLLIYEYMENKSLADVLFDSNNKSRLSWEARFNICLGIAKGLQYLHEHPRLKMVHRGVKAVNILLDSDLKPKISDFGLASIFAEDDQGASQLKIIKAEASHGYMAPEYPMYGTMSTKYDVYGYGVVILELVSGKKNAGHKFNQELEFLVDEICVADSKGSLLDLVDKSLGNSYDQKEAITILKLAVKCTNISPSVRPSMAQAVSLLSGEKTLEEFDKEISNTSTNNEGSAESSSSVHE